jgi:hypothetical protein
VSFPALPVRLFDDGSTNEGNEMRRPGRHERPRRVLAPLTFSQENYAGPWLPPPLLTSTEPDGPALMGASRVASRFLEVVEDGRLDRIVEFLAPDVVCYADGGGKGCGLPKPVVGRDRVNRLLAAGLPQYARIGARMERAEINGRPGALFFDSRGGLINVFAFDTAEGGIQAVLTVINADKLAHLGYPLSSLGWPGCVRACPSRPRPFVV